MKKDDNLKLEKQLCFRLYSLSKLMNRLYIPVLKTLGLTYPQYLVMLVLWESDSDSNTQFSQLISVKQLGEKLDLDSGTLSPLLKRMEKQSLISRLRSSQDERSVEVKLTTKGSQLKQQATEIPEKMFSVTGMKINELQQLNSQLDNLLLNLDEAL
jgi:DNA-binding MarR family transcriptional regulator